MKNLKVTDSDTLIWYLKQQKRWFTEFYELVGQLSEPEVGFPVNSALKLNYN